MVEEEEGEEGGEEEVEEGARRQNELDHIGEINISIF